MMLSSLHVLGAVVSVHFLVGGLQETTFVATIPRVGKCCKRKLFLLDSHLYFQSIIKESDCSIGFCVVPCVTFGTGLCATGCELQLSSIAGFDSLPPSGDPGKKRRAHKKQAPFWCHYCLFWGTLLTPKGTPC